MRKRTYIFSFPGILHLISLLMAVSTLPVLAKDVEPLRSALEHYLRTQTQGLPGKISFSISKLDPATQLSPCTAFEPFLPPGGRLWGKTTVGIRCLGPGSWTVYVPVQINLIGDYLIAAHPLVAGQVLSGTDFSLRNGDLGLLATGTVTDPAQAVGKTVKNSIAAGQPLRADQLVAPWAIQQGQNVKVISKGSGFSVSNEGKALNNAVDGQVAQIRMNSGQVISGVARPGGTVEISY